MITWRDIRDYINSNIPDDKIDCDAQIFEGEDAVNWYSIEDFVIPAFGTPYLKAKYLGQYEESPDENY